MLWSCYFFSGTHFTLSLFLRFYFDISTLNSLHGSGTPMPQATIIFMVSLLHFWCILGILAIKSHGSPYENPAHGPYLFFKFCRPFWTLPSSALAHQALLCGFILWFWYPLRTRDTTVFDIHLFYQRTTRWTNLPFLRLISSKFLL